MRSVSQLCVLQAVLRMGKPKKKAVVVVVKNSFQMIFFFFFFVRGGEEKEGGGGRIGPELCADFDFVFLI